MRNFEKAVEQGKAFIEKHERADLSLLEIKNLCDSVTEGTCTGSTLDAVMDVVCKAFYAGVAVGKRNA